MISGHISNRHIGHSKNATWLSNGPKTKEGTSQSHEGLKNNQFLSSMGTRPELFLNSCLEGAESSPVVANSYGSNDLDAILKANVVSTLPVELKVEECDEKYHFQGWPSTRFAPRSKKIAQHQETAFETGRVARAQQWTVVPRTRRRFILRQTRLLRQ
jgi:hypothetical protein